MGQGKLHGQSVVITGGGSGIGRAAAARLLAAGARVAITGRTEGKLRQVWEELGRSQELLFRSCDVAQPEEAQKLIHWATQQLGKIDILVNNAGLNVKERATRALTIETWQQIIRANLDGAFYCIRAVLPQMLERRDGLIINVSSVAAKRPGPLGGAAYAASKAGMTALSHCLAAEEKEAGLRCTVIFPGEVDTPILEARPVPVTAEQRAKILQPEDVADAILFVAALPPRVTVPELIIKPTTQLYV